MGCRTRGRRKIPDRTGQVSRSHRRIDRAVKQDLKFAYAPYAWRGTAKVRMGQFNEAMPDLNEALKLDPRMCLRQPARRTYFLLRDNGKGSG